MAISGPSSFHPLLSTQKPSRFFYSPLPTLQVQPFHSSTESQKKKRIPFQGCNLEVTAKLVRYIYSALKAHVRVGTSGVDGMLYTLPSQEPRRGMMQSPPQLPPPPPPPCVCVTLPFPLQCRFLEAEISLVDAGHLFQQKSSRINFFKG